MVIHRQQPRFLTLTTFTCIREFTTSFQTLTLFKTVYPSPTSGPHRGQECIVTCAVFYYKFQPHVVTGMCRCAAMAESSPRRSAGENGAAAGRCRSPGSRFGSLRLDSLFVQFHLFSRDSFPL